MRIENCSTRTGNWLQVVQNRNFEFVITRLSIRLDETLQHHLWYFEWIYWRRSGCEIATRISFFKAKKIFHFIIKKKHKHFWHNLTYSWLLSHWFELHEVYFINTRMNHTTKFPVQSTKKLLIRPSNWKFASLNHDDTELKWASTIPFRSWQYLKWKFCRVKSILIKNIYFIF